MMLKLELQYFGHLMRRVDSLEKTLMLGGIGGWSRRGRQRMRWLDGITWVWANSGSWWWTGRPGVLQFMGSQGVRHDWATELNWNNWKYKTCNWIGRINIINIWVLPKLIYKTSIKIPAGISLRIWQIIKLTHKWKGPKIVKIPLETWSVFKS